MITITERISNKVPGQTALFVSFDYKQEIVDCIKQYECKNYDKTKHIWELPLSYFESVVKSLSNYDDITILPCNTIGKQLKNFELLDYKTKSFDHQIEAIQYGLNHDKWLLLDVPGLGKTKTTINLIEELKSKRNLGKVLVICGVNSLKSNWVLEIKKHSNLTCKILGERFKKNGSQYIGSIRDRLDDLKSPIDEDIIITNVETIRSDEIVKELKKDLFDMIVADELHTMKSPTSDQGRNFLKLNAKYKLGLTGTVLLNSPLDLYVPLKFIEAEKSTYTNFKNYFCVFGGFNNHQVVGYKNTNILKEELEANSLRRTKELLDLPPKNIIEEYIDMGDDQQKFYDDIARGVISECDKADLSRMTLLSSIGRLRQVTSYPNMLTSNNISSAKISRALQLVEEITNNGDKVVIFSTFKEPAKYLSSVISNSILVTGDTNERDTAHSIKRFQEDDSCKVFVGTWQKCGTGITLTAASYMIFLDTPYTDGVFQQACDRIYRIGTKSPTFIYNLICKNTVDERVLRIVNKKRYLSDYVVDDVEDEDIVNNLMEYVEDLKKCNFI